MTSQSENTKRIAKNTMLLYGRTIITMLITLYTSRVVLNALGVNDYGIYNVVGGFVSMFSLISSSLTTATQRFITYELGKKEQSKSQEIFSASLIVHFAIAAIILVLFESVGLWFLNVKMNIASERMVAANWVFQTSILSFLISLVSIPYNASIIAHEKMSAFAYIGIFEAVMKLLIVYLLLLSNQDRLVTYSVLILALSIIIRIIYGLYCRKHFFECKFQIVRDKNIFKQMTGFAGWNFIGAGSAILMNQGVNILLNLFFGVVINAARGIAVQVENAIVQFVNNFMMALNPQITKSYAAGDKSYVMSLVNRGARFSFYLYILFSLPIFLLAPQILKFWLNIVPDYTIIFLRLSLINTMIHLISGTMVTVMLATGRIKKYQILVGGVGLLVLPISYFFLKSGFPPFITYLVNFVVFIAQLVIRLTMLRKMVGLDVKFYVSDVLLNVLLVLFFSVISPFLVLYIFSKSFLLIVLVLFLTLISTVLSIYFIGLKKNEKDKIELLIKRKIHYVFSK